MKVLSIDPGYDRVGFAVLEKKPHEKEVVLFSECFTTKRTDPFTTRLRMVGEEMERLIKEYTPTICSLEKLYFATNQKTAMAVSEARGALLYIAATHHLPIFEYTPLEIKQATTGSGSSDKKQMMDMVPRLVAIEKPITHDDEYDAIAVGITCLAQEGNKPL